MDCSRYRPNIRYGKGADTVPAVEVVPDSVRSYAAPMAERLAVIGGGNMGGAIVRGAIRASIVSPREMLIIEPEEAKRRSFASLGCRTSADARNAMSAEQIMLAVKPQLFRDVAEALGRLERSIVVISIMAGKSSASIRSGLGDAARVVRVMPNTPCQIGEGMSAIALGEGAQPGDEQLAMKLFESIGRVVRVDESLLHSVTAVSGSGPAYVFLLAEAMEQAALQLGIAHGDARLLVKQTVLGAAKLLTDSELTADALRRAVTSPGGTTAAATEVMFEREFPQIVVEALAAARDRGRELDEA